MTVKGVDVASYQSVTYNTAGLGFVFVKATEGTNYVNPKHAGQVAHARAVGLVVGHYHFQRPGSPAEQADYFLTHSGARPGDLLACDWEDAGVPGADKDSFIKAVQAAQPHMRILLYCNRDFWLHRDKTDFFGDGLWIADPNSPAGHPNVLAPWTIHQYGISGADLDVANFADLAALKTWAAKGAVAPTVPPVKKPVPPKETPMSETAQVTGLYNDLMKIASLDGDGTHAAGYFLAHARHDALAAFNAVVALEKKVDALTAAVTTLSKS